MKIGIVIALTTAVMLMERHISAAQCKPQRWADGCSHVANFKFKDDCDKHDICYACGYGRGVSRRSCDDRWHNNMKKTCNTKEGWFLRPGCKLVAWIYYRSVRDWAAKSYKVPSMWFCKESWVPPCV